MPDSSPEQTPFELLGGAEIVSQIAQAFYDHMEQDEPALAKLHPLGPDGRILPEIRERFRLFFIGWLGGPQDYMQLHGHPRLRMRHAGVAIDSDQRDAWLRAMRSAFADVEQARGPFQPAARDFVLSRLEEVANFLRNRPDPE
ncbi:MAG: cyanoglobin [Polyangiaceae bacterium]|nr:cyanoglobin [Polyangiaceae bacterium]MCB9608516.1 cyanoglobin [Polyangiaceae bacterium]